MIEKKVGRPRKYDADNKPKRQRELLREQGLRTLFERVERQLTSHKYYRDPECTAVRLAEELGEDMRRINASLKAHVGMGYCKYLNCLRLKDACQRLENPRYNDYSVEEVGLSVGYVSRQHFYLVFTREMGCTPREYRLRAQQK